MDSTTIISILSLAIAFTIMMVLVKKLLGKDDAPDGAKKASQNDGVEKQIAALRRYAQLHEFGFVAPAAISVGGKSIDLDAIIVTYSGIVGVKCMGYNGEVFANPGEKNWLWVAAGERKEFPSPIDLRAADVRFLRDVLSAAGLRNVRMVECHTVFTSTALSMAVPKSMQVLRGKELLSRLENEKYMEDSGFDKEAAIQILTTLAGKNAPAKE